MVTTENGTKPNPSTLTVVPPGPSCGETTIAGSAYAAFEPVRRIRGAIKRNIEMTMSLVNMIDGLPSSPNKCASLLETYELTFKLDIIAITESSLHFRLCVVIVNLPPEM